MKALGMIETRGMVGAIEAVDVACKTADVEVLNRHLVKGGIVTVEIVGDVGAVKVAVEAAAEAVKRLGVYMGSHVIPRPTEEVYNILEKKEVPTEKVVKEEIIVELPEENEVIVEEIVDEVEAKPVVNRRDKTKK
ncbi:BMC domain-containing protein [Cetobacterium somerae]|uniref:BMC domain-containing protein n=1 Tax=Cetobacterium sp. NK01 TaxID=2993530 RepID=UPI0021171CFF|nr:BMC domain-containing protein [Cetobacterium sp. NK01]MCQ8212855.1 BMC domain-containing protein [Cetobacterium sp. NK01]